PRLGAHEPRAGGLPGLRGQQRPADAGGGPPPPARPGGDGRHDARDGRLRGVARAAPLLGGAADLADRQGLRARRGPRPGAGRRRAEAPPQWPASRELRVDDRLKIDFDRHEVWKDGEKVQLRPTEFRLLYHLASNPGVVMTHETLLSRVWGPEYRDASHYVR